MIKIYYCNSTSYEIPTEISEYRLNKINSAKHPKAKLQMINTAKCLKAGFSDFGVYEKSVSYKTNEYGKPFADNHSDIYFSISHTENISICAFYNEEIGIDCENKGKSISAEIIKRYFSKEETDVFLREPLLLWVSKEAIAKYHGKGLALTKNEDRLSLYTNETQLNDIYIRQIRISTTLTVLCTKNKDDVQIFEVK